MISLGYRDVKPVYVKIEEYIIKLITSGAFVPGDVLPSVRELASRSATNPVAVRKAMDDLVEKGYLVNKDEQYIVLSENKEGETQNLLEELNRVVEGLLQNNYSIEDITKRVEMKRERS